MTSPFIPVDHPTTYRCIGLVQGRYFPSLDSFNSGILLIEDAPPFPATVLENVSRWLQNHPERLGESHTWSAWVRTLKESPNLVFRLIRIYHPTDDGQVAMEAVDYFNVRGEIAFQNDGQIGIRVARNRKPPAGEEQAKKWQPFTIVIEGSIPNATPNQFWEFDCRRTGIRLVLEDGRLIQDAPQQPTQEQKQQRQQQRKKPLPAPVAQPETNLGDAMPVSGRMEITLKISEFPADARTVTNGWKEFEVDTGEKLVTIQVKPKVFKKLEEAQQNYPMWVAAIVGKMGAATPKGFILEEPAIQVFEKKPKEQKVETNAAASGVA